MEPGGVVDQLHRAGVGFRRRVQRAVVVGAVVVGSFLVGTVVVGTVIDDTIDDAIRVTVVATGLGGAVSAAAAPPLRTVAPVNAGGEPNYAILEKPTVQRQQRAVGDGTVSLPSQEDLLDVPAFLRRQAD